MWSLLPQPCQGQEKVVWYFYFFFKSTKNVSVHRKKNLSATGGGDSLSKLSKTDYTHYTRSKACGDFVNSYKQIWAPKMLMNARFTQIYLCEQLRHKFTLRTCHEWEPLSVTSSALGKRGRKCIDRGILFLKTLLFILKLGWINCFWWCLKPVGDGEVKFTFESWWRNDWNYT